MNVNIDKVFAIDGPAANAWTFLQDIPSVAKCMPGADISEKKDDTHYVGNVKVRVGPATMAFKGEIEVNGLDAAKMELKMTAKGSDVKGTSSATMKLTAYVRDTGDDKCEVVGSAVVTVTGKMASLGGRMMNQVTDQILVQFGANLANNVLAMGEGEAAEEAAVKATVQPREINAFLLMWKTMVAMIKSLFGGKSSK